MSKFKVGDIIVRTRCGVRFAPLGFVTTVLDTNRYLGKDGTPFLLNESYWELVNPQYPNPPQKHRDLIIAWANGADIQVKGRVSKKWEDTKYPAFYPNVEYRIKTSLSEKDLKIQEIESQIEELKKKVGELRDQKGGE